MFRARIHVSPKPGVLDPQGEAVAAALRRLGFEEVGEARQGKLIELHLAETDRDRALARVEDMCVRLLANPVVERFHIELD